ncbi:MAG: LysM peptidoglycan-binding domain-containing protein [Phycisphaerae bacterium]|nr:LysM peptidoglycan-binding domain-containing protein [Phycisphaerae bacterium]
MNKDYKIGIIAGLILLIGGVAAFLVIDRKQPQEQKADDKEGLVLGNTGSPSDSSTFKKPTTTTDTDKTKEFWGTFDPEKPVKKSQWETDETDKSDKAKSGKEGIVRVEVEKKTDAAGKTDIAAEKTRNAWGLPENTKLAGKADAAADVLKPIEKTTKTEAVDPGGFKVVKRPVDEDPIGENTSFQAVKRPRSLDMTGKTTYKIQGGDSLWVIAEKVYGRGKGKHWTLIAEANPTVNKNALRPGQILYIPKLPAATAKAPAAKAIDHGKVITTVTGQKIYIVSKADTAGLWGIAAKDSVYKKGHLWEHIRDANPTVDPTRLRPGMRLIIPPLPKKKLTPTTTTRGTAARIRKEQHGRTIAADGKKYYIVKSGDAGFWGVSKNVYGDGKYSYLIERANPGVNSDSLQPGDKLVIPPKPAARRTTLPPARPTRTTRPTTTRSQPAPAADDAEPDFGG